MELPSLVWAASGTPSKPTAKVKCYYCETKGNSPLLYARVVVPEGRHEGQKQE